MLTYKVFVNPTTETKANRDGIVHVISRMKWYCELSMLLLRENTGDVETSEANLSSESSTSIRRCSCT